MQGISECFTFETGKELPLYGEGKRSSVRIPGAGIFP